MVVDFRSSWHEVLGALSDLLLVHLEILRLDYKDYFLNCGVCSLLIDTEFSMRVQSICCSLLLCLLSVANATP